jgi:hypothetical protein
VIKPSRCAFFTFETEEVDAVSGYFGGGELKKCQPNGDGNLWGDKYFFWGGDGGK